MSVAQPSADVPAAEHEIPVYTPEPGAEPAPRVEVEPLVEAELLVEDVSIDGMCGVY